MMPDLAASSRMSRAPDHVSLDDLIELWNVADGVPMYVAAQQSVNVVGRIRRHDDVRSLHYRLNGGPEQPVFFATTPVDAARLARPGEFNIDTIARDELTTSNHLQLIARMREGRTIEREVSFPAVMRSHISDSRFALDLHDASHVQQVGQVVDGHWRVDRSVEGEPCLAIRAEDEGLDRIILFGDDRLTTGFTVRARLRINRWIAPRHNVGLLFHWNPHEVGDGSGLPSQWSTGLGYYFSHCDGLRVRVGVDVHTDETGHKHGDHVLGEAVLDRYRRRTDALVKLLTARRRSVPQFAPGRMYRFELRITPEAYALWVWRDGMARPEPQIIVSDPPALLGRGAAGIIAHRCAVQVFEFGIDVESEHSST